MEGKIIIDEQTMKRTLQRLAHEIIEEQPEATEIYLVGIRRRGVPMAAILKENIEKISDSEIRVQLGELDISLYRDDLKEKYPMPVINSTCLPFEVTGKIIILVDDVLFTGRTARAAMDALIEKGRPAAIRLAVMVDRGHRELPICANYVGKNIPTSRSEFVNVHFRDFDGSLDVELSRAGE